jgi:SAM-dependent MidA family methyltransferase
VQVGRQDITADVDFRALAVHGAELGFECVLYTTLATFLKGAGAGEDAEKLREQVGASLDADRELSTVSRLLDEADVGGLFKVMLQVFE